jgi:hypothetical protein
MLTKNFTFWYEKALVVGVTPFVWASEAACEQFHSYEEVEMAVCE